MKHIKKVVTLALAFAMVLAMSVSVFATGSIELKSEPDSFKDNHTYNVYQIFTGTIKDSKLTRVKYGANYGNTGASVPKTELDAITDARAFAETLISENKLKEDPVAQLNKDNNFKATGLADGYYLVVDTANGDLADGDVFSQYIVQVVGDVSIDTKKDVPSSDKKITADDHPATEGGDDNPGISADGKTDNVSIGDKVTFTITSKVPAHATDYDYYYFIINDTLSAGLYLDSASITVASDKSGVTMTKDVDYKVYTGTDAAPHTFEVALTNAKAHPGETITVTYQATLNEDAVIGGDGNLNTQTLTYSNNPNEDYDGSQDSNHPGKPKEDSTVPLGETPDSTTKTFTSGIKLQKLDQDGMALKGAAFTIEGDSINQIVTNAEVFEADPTGAYWKLKTGAYTTEAPQTEDQMIAAPSGSTDGYVVAEAGYEGETITVGGTNYRVVNQDETPTHILKKANANLYDSTETKYKKTTTESVENTTSHVSQALTVNDDGTLNFEGLAAGTYTIKETTVPAGYTKADDVEVVITFNNTTKEFTATVDGKAVSADSTTNLFPVDVVNIAGNALPTTGGIGTVIFYVLGSLLVVGCGIVLISRKRMLNK